MMISYSKPLIYDLQPKLLCIQIKLQELVGTENTQKNHPQVKQQQQKMLTQSFFLGKIHWRNIEFSMIQNYMKETATNGVVNP